MRNILIALFLLICSPAFAQTCPTRPIGDNSNACASTAFVNNQIGSSVPLPLPVADGGLYGATLNAIPYGGGAGTLPSFITAANNAVLATNGSGVPAEVTTLPSALTVPSPTITGNLAVSATSLFTGQQFLGSGTPGANKLATYAYGANGTPLVSLPTAGGAAVAGASWSSLGPGGNAAQIGGIFWGFADSASRGSGTGYDAWGAYAECRTYPSVTSYCAAQENDVTNLSAATVDISPNAPFSAGADEALHLASGGGCTNAAKCYDPFNTLTDLVSRPASALLLLSANGTTANKGIVFDQAGITGADGTDTGGAATAIAFGRGQNQVWYDSNGNIKASIGSTLKTTDPNGLQLDFATGSGLIFANSNGQVFQVYPGASGSQTAEGVAVIGGNPGGGAPTIQATTTDAQSNLNLIVQGRGTGQVSISTGLTSTGTAPTCAVTGAGTGASCALAAGSNDVSGMMVISTGTTPLSSGNISLTLNSSVGAHQAGCMVSAANQGANWNVVSFIKTTVSQTVPVWFWSNNSVNLTASTSNAYGVEYHCIGY